MAEPDDECSLDKSVSKQNVEKPLSNLQQSELTNSKIQAILNELWKEGSDKSDEIRGLYRGKEIFDEAPIGITIGIKDGDEYPLQYANRAFQELTGYSEEEILHQDCQFLQGEKTDPERGKQIGRALRKHESVTVELRNYRKDGSMFWNRLTIAPISTSDKQPQVFIGFQQDVTKRRNIEEKYREQANFLSDITDNIPGVTYDLRRDADGNYSFAHLSDGFEELSGVDSEQAQASFDRVLQAVHPEDRDQLSTSSLSTWRGEFRFVHPDGEVTWVLGSSEPEKRSEGEIAWRGIFIDITERKKLEQQLKAEIKERKRINQLKSDVFARASHDLKTPLNSVLGLSSLLEETDLTPEQQRHVNGIQNAGKSMLFLVKDILDLDRIESGDFELNPEPLELRDLLFEAMSLYRSQIKDSEVTVTETVSDEIPDRVMGDSERLKRILFNLVGNALKHTDTGRVDIAIDCVERLEDRVTLLFSISDTGPGIPKEEQDAIFMNREQGTGQQNIDPTGAGLGLSICQYLVRKMDGEIDVESEPGEGSTFSFTVKLDLPESNETPNSETASESVEGANVLVVDDNASIRHLIERMLEDAGVEVATEGSGQKAIDLLRDVPNDKFDAVFIDRRMGTLSGLDVIKSLDKEGTGPEANRIYVISGDTTENILQNISEEAIAGVVNKPVSESELLDAIRTSLSNQSG